MTSGTLARRVRPFRFFAKVTIATVYVLILLGGIVRSTGSGLGCPDWPRCFGRWIPPTSIDQLPADYKTRYAEDGLPPDKVEFSVVKTWIEYGNRLFGALTGLFIAATVGLAFFAYGFSAPFWLSFIGFVLTGAQGYLGAKVVSSALMPVIITAHNLLAQVIVYVLLAAYWLSRRESQESRLTKSEHFWAVAALVLVMIQFYLGLAVRQYVDGLDQAGAPRPAWVPALLDNGVASFLVHRSFSWLVLGVVIWQALAFFRHRAGQPSTEATQLQRLGLIFVVANVVVGVTLQLAGLPAWAQPVHLLLASLLLGVYFSLAMLGFISRTENQMISRSV